MNTKGTLDEYLGTGILPPQYCVNLPCQSNGQHIHDIINSPARTKSTFVQGFYDPVMLNLPHIAMPWPVNQTMSATTGSDSPDSSAHLEGWGRTAKLNLFLAKVKEWWALSIKSCS